MGKLMPFPFHALIPFQVIAGAMVGPKRFAKVTVLATSHEEAAAYITGRLKEALGDGTLPIEVLDDNRQVRVIMGSETVEYDGEVHVIGAPIQ